MELNTFFDSKHPLPLIHFDGFYRCIFGNDELEREGILENGKYNGIIVARNRVTGKPAGRRYLHDEMDALYSVCKDPDTNRDYFMAPISYAGKNRCLKNARRYYAMTFDIDNIDEAQKNKMSGLERFFEHCRFGLLPEPTYIVTSGHGIHLYYVLETPVAMYQHNCKELQKLKNALTKKLWCVLSSSPIQMQSINQAFRMPDTPTKIGTRAQAYSCGPKTTIDCLNQFVSAVDKAKLYQPSETTFAEAKEKYPKWAERIEAGHHGKAGRHTWICDISLYNWWLKTVGEGVRYGRRYFCLFATAVFGAKCGLDPETIRKDLSRLAKEWDKLTVDESNHLTESDIDSALSRCSENWEQLRTIPIKTISAMTGIAIEKSKRNGRTRKEHLKMCRERSRQKTTKIYIVAEWRRLHKNGTKAQCARDTGLSLTTVRKWWERCIGLRTGDAYKAVKAKAKKQPVKKKKKTICPDCRHYVAIETERQEWTWSNNHRTYRRTRKICPMCGCVRLSEARVVRKRQPPEQKRTIRKNA